MSHLTDAQTDRLRFLSNDKGVRLLHSVYTQQGGDLKMVGGCVRDALLGIDGGDIDLAGSVPPEIGQQWLNEAGITVKPTGIKYGTITAIVDGRPYEITTLRRDVKTDGRWAEVVYGTSWAEDAQRRDFTMNGLFCNRDGVIEDYIGGLDDLNKGIVRFIGDADQRVKEDYLRILRLFRFWARFGTQAIDHDTLAAMQENAEGLKTLSAQRIWAEMKKILVLPRVLDAFTAMQAAHLIPNLFGEQTTFHIAQLATLLSFEVSVPLPHDRQMEICTGLAHLAALCAQKMPYGWRIDWQYLSERFCMSGKETDELDELNEFGEKPDYWLERPLAALYHFERAVVRGAFRLAGGFGYVTPEIVEAWTAAWMRPTAPTLPVTAADLMARGYEHGPAIGVALDKIRQFWMDSNCMANKDICLKALDTGRLNNGLAD